MRRPIVLLIVIVSAVVAAAVATVMTQKPKLEVMTEEERRAFLTDRLGKRVSEEQIDRIAAAISARIGQESTASLDEAKEEATEATGEATSSES
jgi:cell division protein FtsL